MMKGVRGSELKGLQCNGDFVVKVECMIAIMLSQFPMLHKSAVPGIASHSAFHGLFRHVNDWHLVFVISTNETMHRLPFLPRVVC